MSGTVSEPWVVWSKYHGQYWGPERAGYTNNLLHAGIYSEAEARAIETGSDRGDTAISVASRLKERPLRAGLVHHALLAAAREEGRREGEAAHAAQLVAPREEMAQSVVAASDRLAGVPLPSGVVGTIGDTLVKVLRATLAEIQTNSRTPPLPDAEAALVREREREQAIYAEVCEHCKNGLELVSGSYYAHRDGKPITENHCGLVGCGASHLRLAADRATKSGRIQPEVQALRWAYYDITGFRKECDVPADWIARGLTALGAKP